MKSRVHVEAIDLRDSSCKTNKPADHEDVDALTKLYRATDGPNWPGNSNWLKGDPCKDKWYGVCCDDDGGVIKLNLDLNQLKGKDNTELVIIMILHCAVGIAFYF